MTNKIAHLIRRKKLLGGWAVEFAIIPSDRIGEEASAETIAERVLELEGEGYTIIDEDLSISDLNIDRHEKYKELELEDKKAFEKAKEKVSYRKNYPSLHLSEAKFLEDLEILGVEKEGLLWVKDMDLATPEVLEELRERQMSVTDLDTCYHATFIYGENMKTIGRIYDVEGQYAQVLEYFSGNLPLRNASEDEARRFNSKIGRPLNKDELEKLIEKGIEITQQ